MKGAKKSEIIFLPNPTALRYSNVVVSFFEKISSILIPASFNRSNNNLNLSLRVPTGDFRVRIKEDASLRGSPISSIPELVRIIEPGLKGLRSSAL